MSDWQLIGGAPVKPFDQKSWFMAHSPYLLLWNGHSCRIGSYHYTQKGKGKWMVDGRNAYNITHWMPLPEGPRNREGTG